MSSDLDLLQEVSKVFQEIAEFYVSDSPAANKARRKVEKTSMLEKGQSYFHAALLSRLVALNDILDKSLQRREVILDVDIERKIRGLLQFLENLVQDVLDLDAEHHFPDYAGLRNLIRFHRLEKRDERSPRRLGFRICLYCPSPKNQELLKEQLLSCTNAFASRANDPAVTTNLDPESVSSETSHVREWQPPVDITRSARHLHRLLVPWLQVCSCGFPHEQTRTSIMGAQQGGILSDHHDFCYPDGPLPIARWRTLRLQPETPAKPLSVRFEARERGQNAIRKYETTSWRRYRSFCDVADNSKNITDLTVGDDCLRAGRSSIPVEQISTSSLRDYLSANSEEPVHSSKRIGNKKAIVLALVLSYAYLYLSDTAWWPNAEVSPDFWFTRSASGELVVHRPFMSIDVAGAATEHGTTVEELINRQRPSLPAFGKLLLEIWAGRSIDWKGLPSAIQECGEDCLGSYWLCAVQACLGNDSKLKESGSIRQEGSALRDTYVRKVIKSLQWLSEKLCQQSTDDIFLATSESNEQQQKYCADRNSGPRSMPESFRTGAPSPQLPIRAYDQPVRGRQAGRDGPKRLINVHTLCLEEFLSYDGWPEYAILSHRWSAAEVSFAELQKERLPDRVEAKVGWSKIVGACRQARVDHLSYIWVDSCCINKASDSELSEALNSMFRWYRDAKICYAYLADVPAVAMCQESGQLRQRQFRAMSQSDWFRRGWTLQELLAPQSLKFFSADWSPIADLSEIADTISRITKIDPAVLTGSKAIGECSVAQRFSWAAHRRTTKPEDEAYSLLGLFGVSLDARYGIGRLAFDELQRKILESGKGDDSLFAWDSENYSLRRGFFARSPSEFEDCGDIISLQPREVRMHVSCRSDGVGGRLSVYECHEEIDGWSGPAAVLNCRRIREHWNLLAIRLRPVTHSLSSDKHKDYRVAFGEIANGRMQAGSARCSRLISVPQRSAVEVRAREATILMGGN